MQSLVIPCRRFLPDYENYTNAQFDKARAQQPNGFVADNRKHADYNSTVNSWIEQRAFVTQARPALLGSWVVFGGPPRLE